MERVARTLRRHAMLDPGDRVLVAVSGGPDSVALAHLLVAVSARPAVSELGGERSPAVAPFDVVALAHFNHRLRGADSDEDEAFCAALAEGLGLAFERGDHDVRRFAAEARLSPEDAARRLRYQFLRDAAARVGANRIAVAHTRNDQAETLLLRLMRGAGPRGLAGIYPVVGRLFIRPFFDVSRDEVLAWLDETQTPYRIDASNADRGIPRNRVRHELLPYLAEAFNPAIVETLARTAEILREEDRALDGLVAAIEPQVVMAESAEECRVALPPLLALSKAFQRRLVRRAFGRLAFAASVVRPTPASSVGSPAVEPSGAIGFDRVDRLLEAARSGDPALLDVGGGFRAHVSGGSIVLSREGRSENAAAYEYVLDVPGEADIPEAGCRIVASRRPVEDADRAPAGRDPRRVLLDAGELGVRLQVRNRRAGDRFRPLGLGGSKKLQDFFVDRKVARAERDRVPLVALPLNDKGRRSLDAPGDPGTHSRRAGEADNVRRESAPLVWIAGYAIDDRYKVTDGTTEVVELAVVPK